MYATARTLATTLPPGARIAGFNAGILSYYAQRPTVNLDGVMDPPAFGALKRRDLAVYLKARRVDYVVDFDSYVYGEFGRYWGADPAVFLTSLPLRESAPAPANFGSYRVFAVDADRLTSAFGLEAQ